MSESINYKEILEKQMQLLSERSLTSGDDSELAQLTAQMCNIAVLLNSY